MKLFAFSTALLLGISIGSHVAAAPKPAPVVKINLEVTVFEGGKVEVRRGGPLVGSHPKHHGHKKHGSHSFHGHKKGKPSCTRCGSGKCQCHKSKGYDAGRKGHPHGGHGHHGKLKKSDSGRHANLGSDKKEAMRKAFGKMIFSRLDQDNDGKVSLDEMPAERREKFSQVDTSGDGSIDLGELEAAMAARFDQMRARKVSNAKDTKHKDSNELVGRIADQLMQLDANSDRRLNADEVAPRLKSKFSDIDTDGDGYLDSREIRRQIKKRMKQRQRAENQDEEGETNARLEAKQEGQEA